LLPNDRSVCPRAATRTASVARQGLDRGAAVHHRSSDGDQEYLADGIAEDLTINLSRNRRLFVVAHNSALTFDRAR
jgi:hypothetical protein